MTDLWEDLANQTVAPPPEPEDPPKDTWVLAEVVRTGGAAPKYRTINKKDGSGSFNKFECGLKIVGGEKGRITSNHMGRYCFFDSFVEPGEKDGGNPLAGRLMGFFNCCFAPGAGEGLKDAERAQARWQPTVARLRAAAVEGGYDLDQFQGSKSLLIAASGIKALTDTPAYVLVKTKDGGTYEVGGETKKRPLAAGQVEDYTAANLAKRKVEVMVEEVPPAAGGGGGF